jgi:integrase/recombinase XerD
MLEDFCRRRSVLARIRRSRFLPDLEALAAFLERRGHRRKTLVAYLYGAAHLVWCIESGEISLEGLTAESLQRAAQRHFGRCSCPRPRRLDGHFVSVAPHLFEVMRERHGLAPSPPPPPTPVEAILQLFDDHLRNERGLLESTRERYLRDLRVALGARCGHEDVDMSRWTAQDVRDCVAGRAALSLHAARALGVALRGFLRFLTLRGEPVGHLVAAVPTTSRSRLAGLPRGLSEEQLSQLLRSVDVSTPIGLRTRAILECLVSLGLRAGEVAAMRLADIDWRAGMLRINTSKGRRNDVLPLSQTVGRALVAYLKRGRPKTVDGHVFVRHFLPVGEPLISHDITMTVRRAFRRAGLVLPSMGAHVLRHTTASRLARAGVSLKDIADVMRHRDIDTTRIYTKVDWPRLAEVALAWPTVAP